MDERQQTYWELLARYFGGNASEEDKAMVLRKKEQDPSFAQLYLQAQQLFLIPAAETESYEPDVEKGWQRLQIKAQMREASMPTVSRSRNINWPYAASAVAAAFIVLILVAGLWLTGRFTHPDEWVEVQTALHEIRVLELADGSMVTLNENSRLSYPANFTKDSRTVRLSGEAYFEVQKAEGKRFTVLAGGTSTEVIGTAFYLQAYPNREVRIQVSEGKVAFASLENEEAVFLTPGEEAVMDKSHQAPHKQVIEDPNFQAWQSKKLQFNDTRLEAYFDTSIAIGNKDLKNCRFTVSFREAELEEVLEILSLTGNLSIKKESDTYVISGPSCQ
jgi:transmembrane sensor